MKHKDDRRTLVELGSGKTWKVGKIVIAEKDCKLGDHYHMRKIETFMLVKGRAIMRLDDDFFIMELLKQYDVPALHNHSFEMTKGSILVGLASKEFNPKDDYR
jgi:mannose-6-phosphate isomerase-like protein (cupin superfamily)